MGITAYGVKGDIGAALDAVTPASNTLAAASMAIDSKLAAGQSEDLSFLGSVPALEEWFSERTSHQPIEYDYTIRNRKFSSTIQTPLDWVENDKTGLVQRRINMLRDRVVNWRGRLIADLINSVGNAFNGTAFFSSAHSWGDSGTIDNDLTQAAATGTAPTPDEAATAIMNAWQQMLGFLDDRGEPVNEGASSFLVIVGSAYASSHFQALNSDNLDLGTGSRDNPVKGLQQAGNTFGLVASPRITDTDAMILCRVDEGWQPFVFQENTDGRKITAKAEGSDFEHDKDAWEFGIKAVGNAGYGLFTSAVRTVYT